MPEFDNTNRGVLFRDEKRTNEKAPEYTGTINVDGVEKRLAAWIKESKTGKKFFSLSVSDPQPKQGVQSAPKAEDDDSIPF
jgi:uncharacterized protein (DUF736 family)